MINKLSEIFSSWGVGKNVLLYGPPATGKTRLISELFDSLSNPTENTRGILLDPENAGKPFSRPPLEIEIPKPIKVVWTTFHQSYGYEDFVLGLRPEITENVTKLQPWAGVFLDAALELADKNSHYESVVIFIDEINRGNAARIFGEFMTFLDFDYREGGKIALPIPLRQLSFENGMSEEIRRPGGEIVRIPEGFTFPKHIYIVATMNSVDRAAVPIDSALARRFDRIEMSPDLDVLKTLWGLNVPIIPVPTEENLSLLGPLETAYLVLDRLNVFISSVLGPEFELGHGLLTSIQNVFSELKDLESSSVSDEIWINLAKAWDKVVFPQLLDRFSGRQELLLELLKVEAPPSNVEYAWTLRTSTNNNIEARSLSAIQVSELPIEVIKRSFRWLAL